MPSFGPTSRRKEVHATYPALTHASPDPRKNPSRLFLRTLTPSRRPSQLYEGVKNPSTLWAYLWFQNPHARPLNAVTH